jgi:ABC-type sugar transport system ATPase subunit
VLGLADRVAVLCRGRVAGVVAAGEATQEGLLELAMGRTA